MSNPSYAPSGRRHLLRAGASLLAMASACFALTGASQAAPTPAPAKAAAPPAAPAPAKANPRAAVGGDNT